MKNHAIFIRFVCIMLLAGCWQAAGAQEQGLQWYKSYEGYSGGYTGFNEIKSALQDSAGNTYILGCAGRFARWDGAYINPMDSIEGYPCYGNGINSFVAKIDPAGTTQWIRPVSADWGCYPMMNMVMHNDKLHVAVGLEYETWLYFFDTLITQGCHEFPANQASNYFVTLDLDGNLLDQHYVQYWIGDYGEPLGDHAWEKVTTDGLIFGIDARDNFHIFVTSDRYTNLSATKKASIIVDHDTSRHYVIDWQSMSDSVFDPYTTSGHYVFDTSWRLVSFTPLVDHESGWDSSLRGSTYRFQYRGLVFDTDGSMYLSGFACSSVTGVISQPVYIYLDSVHALKVENRPNLKQMPFLIKYNAEGGIEWVQQMYSSPSARGLEDYYSVSNVVLDTSLLYVVLESGNYSGASTFFDSLHTQEARTPMLACSYCVAYDQHTGQYVRHYMFETDKGYLDALSILLMQGDYLCTLLSMGESEDTYPGTEYLYKINLRTDSITKCFPFEGLGGCSAMAISRDGLVFRAESGVYYSDILDDTIPVGSDRGVVISVWYDSVLDLRPQPCPGVSRLTAETAGVREVRLSWRGAPEQTAFEVAYISEGGSWDTAATVETGDTTALLALPDGGCRLFRVRGRCPELPESMGPWSDSIRYCPPVGIPQAEQTQHFRLSPNPASGMVTLQGATEQIESVRIFDMAGRQVSAFGRTATFDISKLPAGSYIVRIQSADQTDQHLRLIKE